MKKYKYHYFYKIVNKINNKFYYGIHSTNDLNDGYMGSGSRLLRDYKIYGKENFVKEIVKYFKTRKQASDYESEVVTESSVLDENCYNMKIGGDYGTTIGTILVKDKESKFFRVLPNDERLKNGDLIPIAKNMVSVFDVEDEKYKLIEKEIFSTNKEKYISVSHGTVFVKDKEGKYLRVSLNDERYLNGDLTLLWEGKKHSEETKKKMSKSHQGKQNGEKNSQYGTCWITKDGINKKIKKSDLDVFVNNGWKRGRIL